MSLIVQKVDTSFVLTNRSVVPRWFVSSHHTVSLNYNLQIEIFTNTKLDFPAVTICNTNKIRLSALLQSRHRQTAFLDELSPLSYYGKYGIVLLSEWVQFSSILKMSIALLHVCLISNVQRFHTLTHLSMCSDVDAYISDRRCLYTRRT